MADKIYYILCEIGCQLQHKDKLMDSRQDELDIEQGEIRGCSQAANSIHYRIPGQLRA